MLINIYIQWFVNSKKVKLVEIPRQNMYWSVFLTILSLNDRHG